MMRIAQYFDVPYSYLMCLSDEPIEIETDYSLRYDELSEKVTVLIESAKRLKDKDIDILIDLAQRMEKS